MREFKGTKGKFKVTGGTVQGTPMCLPNNAIYVGKIKLAQVFGNTIEEATANTILLSKAPEMLEFIQSISTSENTPIAYRKIARKLINEATELK